MTIEFVKHDTYQDNMHRKKWKTRNYKIYLNEKCKKKK